MWASAWRASYAGFALAVAVAFPLGVALGTIPPVRALLEPVIDFTRYLPAVAFIPLIMLWVGIDESAKVAVIFVGTVCQMALLIAGDIARVPSAPIEAARTMGATNGELVQHVLIPAAWPAMLDTLRAMMGLALDLSGGGRTGGRQFRPGLFHSQGAALFADRPYLRRHSADRPCWAADRSGLPLAASARLSLALPAELIMSDKISIRQLDKFYGSGARMTQALQNINLDIAAGEFVTLVGASGCGKSTLLRTIGGLEEYRAGTISCNGAPVDGAGPDRAMVFQSYSLYPWLTVRENVRFCRTLKFHRNNATSADVEAASGRADALIALMGLGHVANSYPAELSGGMQQRVAIARALMSRARRAADGRAVRRARRADARSDARPDALPVPA